MISKKEFQGWSTSLQFQLSYLETSSPSFKKYFLVWLMKQSNQWVSRVKNTSKYANIFVLTYMCFHLIKIIQKGKSIYTFNYQIKVSVVLVPQTATLLNKCIVWVHLVPVHMCEGRIPELHRSGRYVPHATVLSGFCFRKCLHVQAHWLNKSKFQR